MSSTDQRTSTGPDAVAEVRSRGGPGWVFNSVFLTLLLIAITSVVLNTGSAFVPLALLIAGMVLVWLFRLLDCAVQRALGRGWRVVLAWLALPGSLLLVVWVNGRVGGFEHSRMQLSEEEMTEDAIDRWAAESTGRPSSTRRDTTIGLLTFDSIGPIDLDEPVSVDEPIVSAGVYYRLATRGVVDGYLWVPTPAGDLLGHRGQYRHVTGNWYWAWQ